MPLFNTIMDVATGTGITTFEAGDGHMESRK